LVPTPLLLHLPNLVCNHLAISLLLDDVGVSLGLVLAVGLSVDEGALDGGVQLLLCALVHLLDKLRAFLELVPFSMTLVASHGCTLLKLLHHRLMVILRRLDLSLHVLRNVHLFLIVLALAHQICQPLSKPFHFLLKLIILLAYETITCLFNNILNARW
jgi:hypothetical protein